MYTFVFPHNLQFYPPGKTPDIQVNMRRMRVTPNCLEFPYENTKGTEMLWRVYGVNVHLLESRILDGRIFKFKVGSIIETEVIQMEGQERPTFVDKPAIGLEDVQIETVEHVSHCSSESKYQEEDEPLAPLSTIAPDWLFCIDTGHARYWHHRDDLERFATKKNGANEHLLLFRPRHTYIYTPIVRAKGTGDYDTLAHILSNNFAPHSTNNLCPDSFEDEGLVIQTAPYLPKDFDRYRVQKIKHKLGDVTANSDWEIIFNNPKADGKKAQQFQQPRGMDM